MAQAFMYKYYYNNINNTVYSHIHIGIPYVPYIPLY